MIEGLRDKIELREHPAMKELADGVFVPLLKGQQKSAYFQGLCVAYYSCTPGRQVHFLNWKLPQEVRDAICEMIVEDVGEISGTSVPPSPAKIEKFRRDMGLSDPESDEDENENEDILDED